MKTTSKKIAVWSVALLSMAVANGVRAQETKSEADLHSQPSPAEQVTSGDNAASDRAAKAKANDSGSKDYPNASMPAKCNRASSIIGMEVKNPNSERLGKIKDVVF